jgi:hypothetical protein
LIFCIVDLYGLYVRVIRIGTKNPHSFYVYTKRGCYFVRRVCPYFYIHISLILHRSNILKKHVKNQGLEYIGYNENIVTQINHNYNRTLSALHYCSILMQISFRVSRCKYVAVSIFLKSYLIPRTFISIL